MPVEPEKPSKVEPRYIAPGLTVIFADMAKRLEKIADDNCNDLTSDVYSGIHFVAGELRNLCEGHNPAYMLEQIASDHLGYSDWRWMKKMDAIKGDYERRAREAEERAEQRLQEEIARRFGEWQTTGSGRKICL